MSGNDWIEWKGGERPISWNAKVYIRYRNGTERKHADCASSLRWFHTGSGGDIIAYRLHKPETVEAPTENKYHRNIKGVKVDVYDVLMAFNVTCPARAHAIKKLLAAGQRGHKDEAKDLQEAIQAIERSIELLK